MHCHSPLLRTVSIITKLIVSLFAIHYLLTYLGYNLIGNIAAPGTTADTVLHWVVGLAGIYVVIKIVVHLFGSCRECAKYDRR